MNGNPIEASLFEDTAHLNGAGRPVISLSVRRNAAHDTRTADWLLATLIGSLHLYPKAVVRVVVKNGLEADADPIHAAMAKYGFDRDRVTVAYDVDGKVSS